MKFVVVSALDHQMSDRTIDYEKIYGLKLYKHIEEDSLGYSNDESFLYYIELNYISDIINFMNKTPEKKIVLKNDYSLWVDHNIISEKDYYLEFWGTIIIYDNWIE